MQRLLARLFLLIYAGAFLHCQVVPVRSQVPGGATEVSAARGVCKKGGPVAQASASDSDITFSKATPHGPALLPARDWLNLCLALLYPARPAGLAPAANPSVPLAGAFANHPNKAPPIRFS